MQTTEEPTGKTAPQGTAVYALGDQVVGRLWNSYSQSTGEYNGTTAYFNVDETTKTLTLDRVSTKIINGRWEDVREDPSSHVTDRMKRAVRKFIAQEKGTSYWRVKL